MQGQKPRDQGKCGVRNRQTSIGDRFNNARNAGRVDAPLFLCGAFEAGATYISGVTANNWTGGKVVLETVSAKIIG